MRHISQLSIPVPAQGRQCGHSDGLSTGSSREHPQWPWGQALRGCSQPGPAAPDPAAQRSAQCVLPWKSLIYS